MFVQDLVQKPRQRFSRDFSRQVSHVCRSAPSSLSAQSAQPLWLGGLTARPPGPTARFVPLRPLMSILVSIPFPGAEDAQQSPLRLDPELCCVALGSSLSDYDWAVADCQQEQCGVIESPLRFFLLECFASTCSRVWRCSEAFSDTFLCRKRVARVLLLETCRSCRAWGNVPVAWRRR